MARRASPRKRSARSSRRTRPSSPAPAARKRKSSRRPSGARPRRSPRRTPRRAAPRVPRRSPRRNARRAAPRPHVEIPLAYNVTVADVMNRAPVTVGPTATLYDALVLLRTHDITGAPVIDAERNVIGVLSQKDLARRLSVPVNLPDVKGLLDVLMVGLSEQRVESLAKLEAALQQTTVEGTMSRPPFVVRSDAPLELAMAVMSENAISRLPVVDGHRLVGIVTPTDLITAALRSPRKSP